jgi:archaellum component FlaC
MADNKKTKEEMLKELQELRQEVQNLRNLVEDIKKAIRAGKSPQDKKTQL